MSCSLLTRFCQASSDTVYAAVSRWCEKKLYLSASPKELPYKQHACWIMQSLRGSWLCKFCKFERACTETGSRLSTAGTWRHHWFYHTSTALPKNQVCKRGNFLNITFLCYYICLIRILTAKCKHLYFYYPNM